jgi:hypothetical protein
MLTVIVLADGKLFLVLISTAQKPYVVWYFDHMAIECPLERC